VDSSLGESPKKAVQTSGQSISLVGGHRVGAPGRELLRLGLEAEVVNAQSSRRIRGRPKRNELDGRCGYDKKEESRAARRFGSAETL